MEKSKVSAAEKIKKWRANLSEEKKNYYKQKDKENKRKKYQNRSKSKKQEDRVNERLKKQKQRTRKKAAILQELQQEAANSSDSHLAYKSPQSLGKALSKVRKALPASPRKRKCVIEHISMKENLLPKVKKTTSAKKKLSEEVQNTVVEFYHSDEISYQAPGRKDSIVLKDSSGEKVVKQKKYMLYNLKEAYAHFKAIHPNIVIGKSKFAEFPRRHILPVGEMPHNMCICVQHANIDFLLKSHPSLPETHKELLYISTCGFNVTCMTNKCNTCKDGVLFEQYMTVNISQSRVDISEEVSYNTWIKNSETGQYEKVIKECELLQVLEEVRSQIPVFANHTYEKSMQSEYFKKLREDPEQVLLQVDFSENFTFIDQDEIQAAHWNNTQCTIYTAVAWYPSEGKKESSSFVIISNYMHHDKYAVHTFNQIIIEQLQRKVKVPLSHVHIFSDGAASHFKQRYTLCNITCESPLISWHFFASAHGKGAVDGVGGTIKRLVFNGAKANRWAPSPKSAIDFAKCAQSATSAIEVLYCSQEQVKQNIPSLDNRLQDILPIPGIHRVHSVKVKEPYIIEYSHASGMSNTTILFSFRKDINPLDNCNKFNDNPKGEESH